jgi:hypothetical protein
MNANLSLNRTRPAGAASLQAAPIPLGIETGRSELALAAELAGVSPEDVRAYLEWALRNARRLELEVA